MRAMSILAALGLCLAPASCGDGGGGSGGDSDSDSDSDGDSDTDSDSDADLCGNGVIDPGELCDAEGEPNDRCGDDCAVTCLGDEVLDPDTGHCYVINGHVDYWTTGRWQCQEMGEGFDLVAPTTIEEISFLHGALELAESWAYWTAGHTVLGETAFKWVTGEEWAYGTSGEPWQGAEPDDVTYDPYTDWCVAMRTDVDGAEPWLVLEDFTCGGADTICEWTPPGTVPTPEQAFLAGMSGRWHASIGASYTAGCICLNLDSGGGVELPSGIAFSDTGLDIDAGDIVELDPETGWVDILVKVDTTTDEFHWHIQGTVDAAFESFTGNWVGVEDAFWDDALTMDRSEQTCQELSGTSGAPC
ncbi:MAG: C-type lectin domain-containing protein [Proteobacteria bacterium]|jgi:hypothetical protein|nr:C-type lectin domain-containing protein [Pseudomonadota bacterium]